MTDPQDVTYPQMVRIDQRRETPWRAVHTSRLHIGYLYSRSSESQAGGVEGQDYLALKVDEQRVTFAVCDGVGQSFCGHLAAGILGDALVEWLSELPPSLSDSDLAARAMAFLSELTESGQQQVLAYDLSPALPALLREALEGQRAYGSEAMFVAGRLDFSTDAGRSPQGGRLQLIWLGDAEFQIFDRAGNPLDVGDPQWLTRERWSTARGVRGASQVHAWAGDLGEIGQVIAYSDGLETISSRLQELVDTPDQLWEETERIHRSAESDDISLVDIRLRPPRSPYLLEIRNPWRFRSYELHWSPVPRTAAYLLEESNSRDFADVRSHVIQVPFYDVVSRRPGRRFYRVRAIEGGVEGPPSNVQETRTHPVSYAFPFLLLLAGLILVLLLVRF